MMRHQSHRQRDDGRHIRRGTTIPSRKVISLRKEACPQGESSDEEVSRSEIIEGLGNSREEYIPYLDEYVQIHYPPGVLSTDEEPRDPWAQYNQWCEEARGEPEPFTLKGYEVAVLCTVGFVVRGRYFPKEIVLLRRDGTESYTLLRPPYSRKNVSEDDQLSIQQQQEERGIKWSLGTVAYGKGVDDLKRALQDVKRLLVPNPRYTAEEIFLKDLYQGEFEFVNTGEEWGPYQEKKRCRIHRYGEGQCAQRTAERVFEALSCGALEWGCKMERPDTPVSDATTALANTQ